MVEGVAETPRKQRPRTLPTRTSLDPPTAKAQFIRVLGTSYGELLDRILAKRFARLSEQAHSAKPIGGLVFGEQVELFDVHCGGVELPVAVDWDGHAVHAAWSFDTFPGWRFGAAALIASMGVLKLCDPDHTEAHRALIAVAYSPDDSVYYMGPDGTGYLLEPTGPGAPERFAANPTELFARCVLWAWCDSSLDTSLRVAGVVGGELADLFHLVPVLEAGAHREGPPDDQRWWTNGSLVVGEFPKYNLTVVRSDEPELIREVRELVGTP